MRDSVKNKAVYLAIGVRCSSRRTRSHRRAPAAGRLASPRDRRLAPRRIGPRTLAPAVLTLGLLLTDCAVHPVNQPLREVDPEGGYRFRADTDKSWKLPDIERVK